MLESNLTAYVGKHTMPQVYSIITRKEQIITECFVASSTFNFQLDDLFSFILFVFVETAKQTIV